VLRAAARAGAGTTVHDDLDDLPATTQAAIALQQFRTCLLHPITAHGQADPVGAVVSWSPATTLSLGVRDCLATTARLAGIAMSVHGNADELRTAAMIDSLTGCGNRRQLDAWVADVRGHVAVLVVDLDDFKLVNDRYGHPAGDVVLAEVARRLETSFRAGALVARAGGDEFAVLIPGITNRADATAAARRFSAAMREPIRVGTTALDVTASVGSAINVPGTAMSLTFAEADADLYGVKARRRSSSPRRTHPGDSRVGRRAAPRSAVVGPRAPREDDPSPAVVEDAIARSGDVAPPEAWTVPRSGSRTGDGDVVVGDVVGGALG
jgi:diguanylate cyclase (GGDEF)-like protein